MMLSAFLRRLACVWGSTSFRSGCWNPLSCMRSNAVCWRLYLNLASPRPHPAKESVQQCWDQTNCVRTGSFLLRC